MGFDEELRRAKMLMEALSQYVDNSTDGGGAAQLEDPECELSDEAKANVLDAQKLLDQVEARFLAMVNDIPSNG